MKNIFLAAKNLTHSRDKGIVPESSLLGGNLHDALHHFVRVNRGHQHLLNIVRPGQAYDHRDQHKAQIRNFIDAMEGLLERIVSHPQADFPKTPAFTTFFNTEDENGWIEHFVIKRLSAFCHWHGKLADGFRCMAPGIKFEEGQLRLNLTFTGKRLTAYRTLEIDAAPPRTIRQYLDVFLLAQKEIQKLSKDIANWPEFNEKATQRERAARLHLDFRQFLARYPQAEQEYILQNWASFKPNGIVANG